MALIRINTNPSPRDLRWFGALFGAFFGLAGAIAWWRWGSHRLSTVLWATAVVIPAIYYALPRLRRPMFLGWSYLVFPIGLAVSYLVLAAVYFSAVWLGESLKLAILTTRRHPGAAGHRLHGLGRQCVFYKIPATNQPNPNLYPRQG